MPWRGFNTLLLIGECIMKKSGWVARGGILTAFTVLLIYIAYIMPGGKLAAFVAVSFLPLVLLRDRAVLASLACYIACTALIFLLIPNPVYFIAYGFFFGLYPLMRHWFEHIGRRWMFYMLLVLFCEISGIAAYFIIRLMLGEAAVGFVPFWVLAVCAQAAIGIFIWLYEYCSRAFLIFIQRLKIFKL